MQAWLAKTLAPGQRVGVDASQLSVGAAKYVVAFVSLSVCWCVSVSVHRSTLWLPNTSMNTLMQQLGLL